MKPRILVVQDWPQPDTFSPATVAMFGSRLVIGYGTGGEQYALVSFASAADLKAGGANDEVLHGHPLYGFGLKHYAIHRIENSPWLKELEAQNAVHPQHDQERFLRDKVHYLFAFKEETVECIVRERHGDPAHIEVFPSQHAALQSLKGSIDA